MKSEKISKLFSFNRVVKMYLNNHSYYSLRYGTISIEQLVGQARNMGIEALALTDINNSTGMIDFVKACRKQGIQPIAGVEFRNGDNLLYTGIARNNEGFRELNEMLTHHNMGKTDYPLQAPFFHMCMWFILPVAGYPVSCVRTNISVSDCRRCLAC